MTMFLNPFFRKKRREKVIDDCDWHLTCRNGAKYTIILNPLTSVKRVHCACVDELLFAHLLAIQVPIHPRGQQNAVHDGGGLWNRTHHDGMYIYHERALQYGNSHQTSQAREFSFYCKHQGNGLPIRLHICDDDDNGQ